MGGQFLDFRGGDNLWILWGDTTVMRGDIELMGVPPLGKTLLSVEIITGSFLASIAKIMVELLVTTSNKGAVYSNVRNTVSLKILIENNTPSDS